MEFSRTQCSMSYMNIKRKSPSGVGGISVPAAAQWDPKPPFRPYTIPKPRTMNCGLQKEKIDHSQLQLPIQEANILDLSFIDGIDLKTIDRLLLKEDKRTTIVMYPLPSKEICPIAALVAMLEINYSGRYQFLLVKQPCKRALYVDMKSPEEVIRLILAFDKKSWKEISSGSFEDATMPKIGFWKEYQGIEQLSKRFSDCGRWLQAAPNASSEFTEGIPHFFLNSETEKYMPLPAISLDYEEDEEMPDELEVTPLPSEKRTVVMRSGSFFLEKGNIVKFQYHELLNNIKKIKKEKAEDPCPIVNIESETLKEFMIKMTIKKSKEDLQKLKEDVIEIIKLRYSPEFYCGSENYNLYCEVYRRVCNFVENEMGNFEIL